MGKTLQLRNPLRVGFPLFVAACAMASAGSAHADTYAGNGGGGFGGPVGNGSFAITDDGVGNITFKFTPSATHASVDGNNLVIYLSTGATGITDTFPLSDAGDTGRRGISGWNPGTGGAADTRSVLDFPSGFQATYAFAFEGAYVGLFQLPLSGGNGGLSYLTGTGQSSYPLSVTIPASQIGLAPGQSFQFIGTLIDGGSAYRSNETFGTTSPNIALGGNPGSNNLITFTSGFSYTITPEPTSTAAMVLGGGVLMRRRSRSTR